MANVDFHNVVDVSVKHVHKYTGGWGDGDSYTIAFHILDYKNEINQLTIYTQKAEVVEQLNTANLVIDEVA